MHALLERISSDYDIPFNELMSRYQAFLSDKSPGKRGRKKKQHAMQTRDEYIETEEFIFDGTKYLIDTNNNVYSYDIQNPILLGHYKDDMIEFIQSQ